MPQAPQGQMCLAPWADGGPGMAVDLPCNPWDAPCWVRLCPLHLPMVPLTMRLLRVALRKRIELRGLYQGRKGASDCNGWLALLALQIHSLRSNLLFEHIVPVLKMEVFYLNSSWASIVCDNLAGGSGCRAWSGALQNPEQDRALRKECRGSLLGRKRTEFRAWYMWVQISEVLLSMNKVLIGWGIPVFLWAQFSHL